MKNTKLWIADSLAPYVEALMEYVNLKKHHLFQVRACTGEEQLIKALAAEEMDILLISAEWYERYRELIHQKCVLLLSEGSVKKEFGTYPLIYKYQSAETILREVMYHYSEQETEETYFAGVKKEHQVIGMFSPVGGIGTSMFALTLGQILAEDHNVLYLNLEECSGQAEIMGSSHWNISDMIYFLRQENNTQFLYRLNSMVRKLGNMDYIPACESYLDFQQITVEEWKRLLQLIRTQSSYDFVALDMGNRTGHEIALLRQCDGIYMPVRRDLFSQARISQWEHYIQILDGMDVLEKLQKIDLPTYDESLEDGVDLCMLPQQKLGHYIRSLLQE